MVAHNLEEIFIKLTKTQRENTLRMGVATLMLTRFDNDLLEIIRGEKKYRELPEETQNKFKDQFVKFVNSIFITGEL